MELTDLERFNSWWRTGKVKDELLYAFKRLLYTEIAKTLSLRQITALYGLRRVGKTSLLYQIIQELLSKNKAQHIFYFSFDEQAFDVKDVMETYQKLVLGKTLEETSEKIFIFFDEIHKVDDWENKLKVYYDLYPSLKFFISGSAAVSLRKRGKENLAGRIFEYYLEPLSFEEFLQLCGKNIEKIKENLNLWKRELIPLFYRYISYGMFPELVKFEDEELARQYLLNTILDRIIYKDIPEEFEIKDLELLKSLVFIIGKNPGMLVNYKELAKDLGRDERTISNYFTYLEFGLIVRFVYNYRGSAVASFRKLKKVYFTTPNFIFAFQSDKDKALPQMLENIVCVKSKAKFFYRNAYEVDFILSDKGITAIEVKSGAVKLHQLLKFREKFKVDKSIIIDFEKEGKEKKVELIPAWKYCLQEKP